MRDRLRPKKLGYQNVQVPIRSRAIDRSHRRLPAVNRALCCQSSRTISIARRDLMASQTRFLALECPSERRYRSAVTSGHLPARHTSAPGLYKSFSPRNGCETKKTDEHKYINVNKSIDQVYQKYDTSY